MTAHFSMRASSIADALDCMYRWEGKHLLGMRSPLSGAAHLGTSVHKGTAIFDQSRVERAGLTADDAAGVFVDALRHPEEPVNWGDNSSVREAERIGLQLTTRYCNEVSPRYDFRAVEMTTTPLDIEIEGITLTLTGTMDRSRQKAGQTGLGVIDLKSGKRAVDPNGRAVTAGHIWQLAVYEILTSHTTGLPVTEDAEIIGLSTSKGARIGTAKVKNARAALLGTNGEKGVLEMLAADLKAGTFRPNPRSALCSQRWCCRWDSCQFHG